MLWFTASHKTDDPPHLLCHCSASSCDPIIKKFTPWQSRVTLLSVRLYFREVTMPERLWCNCVCVDFSAHKIKKDFDTCKNRLTFGDIFTYVIQEVDGRVQIAYFQQGFLLAILWRAEVEVVVELRCFWISQTYFLRKKKKIQSHNGIVAPVMLFDNVEIFIGMHILYSKSVM